jgi:hypothetical protein
VEKKPKTKKETAQPVTQPVTQPVGPTDEKVSVFKTEDKLHMDDEFTLLKKYMLDFTNETKDVYSSFFDEYQHLNTISAPDKLEVTLCSLFDRYEVLGMKLKDLQTKVNSYRHVLLDCLTPTFTNDQLLERFKTFYIQYATKMKNYKQEFETDIPNKIEEVSKKLHVHMEKADENNPFEKETAYRLDNNAKKSVISVPSDSESDTDSDKPKSLSLKPKGKKNVKMTKLPTDSD